MQAAPVFGGKVAVDVVYERPSFLAGDVFRCVIELRALTTVELLVAQLVGTVTASNRSAVALLQKNVEPYDYHEKFTSFLFEDAGFPPGVRPPTEDNTIRHSEDNDYHQLADEAIVPPVASVSERSQTAITILSAPVTITTSEKAHSLAWYKLEFRLPPFLPPTTSELRMIRYTYQLSLSAKCSGKDQVTRIPLPIHIIGGPSAGLSYIARPSYKPVIDDRLIHVLNSRPELKASLSRGTLKWFAFMGASERSSGVFFNEFKLRGNLTMPMMCKCEKESQSSCEYEVTNWLLDEQFSDSKDLFSVPDLLVPNTDEDVTSGYINFIADTQSAVVKRFCGREEHYGLDTASTEDVESYRLLHEDNLVATVTVSGETPYVNAQPAPGGTAFLSVASGSTIKVSFDFSRSEWPVLEAHATLYCHERLQQQRQSGNPMALLPRLNFLAPLGITGGLADQDIRHSKQVLQLRALVAHQKTHVLPIFISPKLIPSFISDLVEVSYTLLLTLYVVQHTDGTEVVADDIPSWKKIRQRYSKKNLAEVSYAVKLHIHPLVTTADVGSPTKLHLLANAHQQAENFKRCHRAFLI